MFADAALKTSTLLTVFFILWLGYCSSEAGPKGISHVLAPESLLDEPLESAGSAYYVAPSGDDANDGSESSPWRTIAKAGNTMVPGDTAVVREGTYREALVIETSGTSDAPIAYRAHPGENVVLDGRVDVNDIVIEPWEMHRSSIFRVHVSEWDLGQVFEDGRELDKVDTVRDMHRGSWYINVWLDILYIWCFDEASPDAHDIEVVLNVGFHLDEANYVTVDGFDITGFSVNGIVLSNSAHNTITNNHIYENGVSGIEVHFEGSHDNLLEGNIASDNGLRVGGASGISLWRVGPGNIVRGNVSHGTKQPDELFADGNGIIVDQVFENGALVENNVVFDNDGSGVVVYESSNVVVRNNTAVHNGNSPFAGDNRCGFAVGGLEAVPGNVIVNNIAQDNYLAELCFLCDAVGENNTIDYNIWYRSDGEPVVLWCDELRIFPRHQFLTPYDAHSRAVRPSFRSLAENDYRLKPDSGAIGAGDSDNSPGDDLDGRERPFGEFVDMGAYEFRPE